MRICIEIAELSDRNAYRIVLAKLFLLIRNYGRTAHSAPQKKGFYNIFFSYACFFFKLKWAPVQVDDFRIWFK